MELSKRAMSIKASTTMAISSKAAEMKAAGLPVVTFGAGEPDFNTPEHIRRLVSMRSIMARHAIHLRQVHLLSDRLSAIN